jgi:glucose/mannose transport system substrate-binding protein
MKRLNRREFLKMSALVAGGAALASCAPPPAAAPGAAKPAAGGKLEIFSWWTSGGEIEALNGLYEVFKKRYPGVEIVNAAIAGGTSSGGDMKAVLQTRMMGGDPPESFQVHLGGELLGSYVAAGQMEDLEFLYKEEGWDKVFPKELIEIASTGGKPYSVPVNIHRSNMMWYNKKMLEGVGAQPPKTWDEWFALAEKLKAKGQPTLAIAESGAGFTAHVFETMMIPVLGADKFKGLFSGATKWDDKGIGDALNILKKALDYANPDFVNVSWGDVNELLVNGKVGMIIQGDWTPGVLWSKKFQDFGWAPAPGNVGIYQMLSDSFGLPKKVKNREAAINWLRVCGSKEGQDAFNPAKGSIPARTDADIAKYGEYHKSAMADWKKDKLVPSIVHGAAAKLSFMTDFMNAINVFATKKNVEETQAALLKAAKDAGLQK